MSHDPTDLEHRRAHARGTAQSHGAATEDEQIQAFARAAARRRAESQTTALVVSREGEPRGYSPADHERAETLRDEAASMRRLAETKAIPSQRRLVESEADGLERLAEDIVPLEHARAGWR